jgi:hypothetical protein
VPRRRDGFLLTPDADRLFDRGLISFADDGAVLVSPIADREAIAAMGIDLDGLRVKGPAFSTKQKHYLAKHRRAIFKRIVE